MSLETLHPGNHDGVVSALTGNGRLCTTLGPDGFHRPPGSRCEVADRTQVFILAGRRHATPQHEYLDFGSLARRVWVDGKPSGPTDFRQSIDPVQGLVNSELDHGPLHEVCRSCVTATENCFVVETVLSNHSDAALNLRFRATYSLGEPAMKAEASLDRGAVSIAWQHGVEMGTIRFVADGPGAVVTHSARAASGEWRMDLAPGEAARIGVLVQFIDRMEFAFPRTWRGTRKLLAEHKASWTAYQSDSVVTTGNATVDAMRRMALYTLRCQATPWSIPASLSIPYWGGGAFHDELYPLTGLLTSGDLSSAIRVLRFRLATLQRALERANYRGALFPWSSTESGEERDPDGLWLTERFHLGQFAASIRTVWRYTRNVLLLRESWPVIDALASYFELNLVEKGSRGEAQMRPCVDFDESVGSVRNGPFTVGAAISTLEFAAFAAEALGIGDGASRRAMASDLRSALPVGRLRTDQFAGPGEVFAIPDGKPLHYSIIGPVFPFEIEVDSDRARRSAEHITEVCRSTRGWKSGFSPAFNGSNWMWTAGHLGIVHAMQGNGSLAWDAVRRGPESAGPMLSPNEHRNGKGVVQVPWFTTGVGAWLAALNMMFVRVDDEGPILLGACAGLPGACSFSGLPGSCGIRVSGEFADGRPLSVWASAPNEVHWTFRVPIEYRGSFRGAQPYGNGRFSRHSVTIDQHGTALTIAS